MSFAAAHRDTVERIVVRRINGGPLDEEEIRDRVYVDEVQVHLS